MRFYESKLLRPIPVIFFIVALGILNPLHIPPDSPAKAMEPVVVEMKPVLLERDPEIAKTFAKNLMPSWGWKSDAQWQCLLSLWTKESNWRPDAYNKTPVYQKGEKLHAGGIPQILGLDPKTSVEQQINRGFIYIESRYSDPCSAWRFWERNFWY